MVCSKHSLNARYYQRQDGFATFISQTIIPYTLNLRSDECQLSLNKNGGKLNK